MTETAPIFPALQIARSTKAYDVRGKIPEDLSPEAVRLLGRAFTDAVGGPSPTVVVGRDMRESGVELSQAFIEGLLQHDAQVIDIGLCSTDELYFASGSLNAWGAMFTASHNPAVYNGIKFCAPGARPLSIDSGLGLLRDHAISLLQTREPERPQTGSVSESDMLRPYAEALRQQVELKSIRPLRVVVDAANAMAGLTVPGVLGTDAGLPALPLEIIPMNFELDGTFPVHEANPIEAKNTADLQRRVVEVGADLGLAFDGDADRCFVIDEKGNRVSPSALTSLIGLREAAAAADEHPMVLYNVITSRSVKEILEAAGISTTRTRVGHSFIKKQMAELNAVFGGEHSGHFYFRSFYGADSGLLAAMHVLAAVGGQNLPLSQLTAELNPYFSSGEINLQISDPQTAVRQTIEACQSQWPNQDLTVDELDGVTLSHWETAPRWWANIRPSNTEPLLRLNVEATEPQTLDSVVEFLKTALEN